MRCENLGDWVGNLRCWECSVGNAKDWKMWPKKMVWARGDWLVSKKLLPCQHFTCNFFIIKINPKIKFEPIYPIHDIEILYLAHLFISQAFSHY